MVSKKITDELNRQLNMEIQSAYIYLAMAGYCHAINMEGSARWLTLQSKEELEHGMKIMDYLAEQGATVTLQAIPQPQNSFQSLAEVFKKALEHEQKVTASINSIASAALEEKDNTTYGFLGWFLKEQVEEVSSAERNIARIELLGSDPRSLFFLDAELGRRAED